MCSKASEKLPSYPLLLFYCEVIEEMLQAEYSLVMNLNGVMYLKGTLSLENKPYQEKIG